MTYDIRLAAGAHQALTHFMNMSGTYQESHLALEKASGEADSECKHQQDIAANPHPTIDETGTPGPPQTPDWTKTEQNGRDIMRVSAAAQASVKKDVKLNKASDDQYQLYLVNISKIHHDYVENVSRLKRLTNRLTTALKGEDAGWLPLIW
jgi:hypothetical protein